MKKSKLFSRKGFKLIVKICFAIFVVIYLLLVPIYIIPNVLNNKILISQTKEYDFMGVLEIWHIESFEGGSVSRQVWLEKRGIDFSKKYEGCYVVVKTMTKEQVLLNLENGKYPNMFSFSIGLGETVLDSLSEYNGGIYTRDDLTNGGVVNNKVFAVPYMLGGYSIFSKNEITQNLENASFGDKDYNNFAISLAVSNYKISKNETVTDIDSFTAYDKYINNKITTLIGTQRDSYRINNRIENGKMTNENISHLGKYSDLIQYIGVCKCGAKEYKMCVKFIEFLQSKEIQSTLSNISMFSVLDNSIYNSGYLYDIENALKDKLKTINVFLSDDLQKQLHDYAIDYVTGKVDDFSKINKYLIG